MKSLQGILVSGLALLIAASAVAQEPSRLQRFIEKRNELVQNDLVDQTQWHGFVLDDQYQLYVEHKNDTATIQLRKWNRPPGGPFVWFDPETDEDESIIRFEDQIDLFRIRSQVLVPSPPNYLKNPGKRYRITIDGIAVAPEFHSVFEVNAGVALGAVFAEINHIYNRQQGTYRTAVFYGALIAMRVLNQSAHLPAELPLGIIKSRAAKFRIEGEYLTRREQPRIERFPTEAKKMQAYARSFSDDPAVLLTAQPPAEASKVAPAPATLNAAPQRKNSYGATSGRSRRDSRTQELAKPEEALKSIHDKGEARRPMGQAGRPLTVPEHQYPAIAATQMENLNLLLGGMTSPMEQRLNR